MNCHITFQTPVIKTAYEWQLIQDVNVVDDNEQLIAKAEIEILTLNKHRDAKKSYQLLDEQGATDWEIPLNLFFKNQNLNATLSEQLKITPETKKSAQHIMIEAISVLPEFRNQGIATKLLTAIATEYKKAQSLFVLAMPLSTFIDPNECENEDDSQYYQAIVEEKTSTESQIKHFFEKSGFLAQTIDEQLLAEPLPFELLLTSPAKLLS